MCILLCACTKASDRAKNEYEMMMRLGATGDERCTKLQQIADAYLSEQNEREYQLAKVKADNTCLQAGLDRMDGTTRVYRSQ